jgi:PPP family 3-phenylpropionic acid transporter
MSAVFAAFGFTSGVHLAYMPVWLEARGLGSEAIAFILSVPLFVRVLLTPAIGLFSDRLPDRRVAVQAMTLASGLSFLLLWPLPGLWPIFVLVPAMVVLYQGAVPLVDAITLTFDRRGVLSYGSARLWGSAGYIATNVACGIVVGAFGAPVIFPIMLVALGLFVAVTFLIPPSRPVGAAPPAAAPAKTVPRRQFYAFLAAAGLLQGSHALLYSFGSLHWLALGYSEAAVGFLWAIGTFSEIGVFALAGTRLRNARPHRLMMVAIGFAVLRWLLMPFDFGFGYQLLLQCAHAGSFGAAHLATMRFISQSVPETRAATAQGSYAMLSGLAMGFATLASGPLFATLGAWAFVGSAAVALAALPALVLSRRPPQPQSEGSAG